MIQFWSNTPVYIDLTSAFKFFWDVSNCFLVHQSMPMPLKRQAFEVTDHPSEISLSLSTLHYLWRVMEHSWVLLICALPDLNNNWFGISFILKILYWIHDRFTRVMHEIFHTMSEGKKWRLYRRNNKATLLHSKTLKVISCLNSDVHEATKPVI